MENNHTLYCFKNCGLLHLSTQTFPKNIIVNHLINGENRRDYPHKGKRISPPSAMTWLDKTSHVHRVQHHLASTRNWHFQFRKLSFVRLFCYEYFSNKRIKSRMTFQQLAGVALPCEQGLHFRCVSWRAKSFARQLTQRKCSLCSQSRVAFAITRFITFQWTRF